MESILSSFEGKNLLKFDWKEHFKSVLKIDRRHGTSGALHSGEEMTNLGYCILPFDIFLKST
jgi:hypothetical protein